MTVPTELGGDSYSVPGPDKTLTLLGSPKLDRGSYITNELWKAGRFQEAIKMEREARQLDYEKEKVFNMRMDNVSQAIKAKLPSFANSLIKTYGKQDDRFKMFGNIIDTPQGISSFPIVNPNTGKVEALQILDSDGKPHGAPYKLDTGFDPKDIASLEKATTALALAKTPEEKAVAQQVVGALQKNAVWKRQMEALSGKQKLPNKLRSKRLTWNWQENA
jgi:hypothetical protein